MTTAEHGLDTTPRYVACVTSMRKIAVPPKRCEHRYLLARFDGHLVTRGPLDTVQIRGECMHCGNGITVELSGMEACELAAQIRRINGRAPRNLPHVAAKS